MARTLLNTVNQMISPVVLPDAQCGFCEGRRTIEMVLRLRQVQDKCQ